MRAIGILVVLGAMAAPAHADRVKDLATIAGVRGNALTGFGIVVGLDGTGDDARSPVVRESMAKMLKRLGITVDAAQLKAKNVAAVMVTGELPAFARPGMAFDITVSSMGTAKSLAGGTLLVTALKGPDQRTWAIAQGSLSLGGFTAEAGSGSSTKKNHVTVGKIPGGATVEAAAPTTMPKAELALVLGEPDFTTATRVAKALGDKLGGDGPKPFARDATTVVVPISASWRQRVPELIATIEAVRVDADTKARVVIDERTGTIVVGEHVELAPAAVAFGGLTVEVGEAPEVSQPGLLSRTGETVVVPRSTVTATEQPGDLKVLPRAATVGDVTAALSSLGAKPRDLVSILRALKAAGALRADLESM